MVATTEEVLELHGRVRECTACPLHLTRTQAVPGYGPVTARVMAVGEAPGENEDREGKPFVGAAGRLLTTLLESVGLDRRDIYITNIVKCRPPRNRDPEPLEVEACSHFLDEQIALAATRRDPPSGASRADATAPRRGRHLAPARRAGASRRPGLRPAVPSRGSAVQRRPQGDARSRHAAGARLPRRCRGGAGTACRRRLRIRHAHRSPQPPVAHQMDLF